MQGILKSIMKTISLALVITLIFSPATTSFAGQSTQGSTPVVEQSGGDKWIPWIQAGGKLGDERAIGATEALVPLYQANDGMWFADVHFKDIDGSAWEGNVGGGYRQLFRDAAMPYILGINGFWDHANSDRGNVFNQGGIGVEFLTAELDLRANGYLPEDKTYLISETYSDVSASIIGNTITTRSNRNQVLEDALPGFDVEAGIKIPGLPAPHDLRVYGGYYYFEDDDAPTIDGPRARAEWRINDVFNIPGSRVTIEGSWQDDDVRSDEWFGGISIRIPLDFFGRKYNKNQTPIEKRMMEGIVRDLDIVTADSSTVEALSGPAINPFTGRPYSSIYFADESTSGVGTQDDPEDLTDAINDAGVDGVVAALDTTGTITDAPQTLLTGQVLIGGGGALPIQTPEGASGFLTIPGGGPATIDGGGSTVITLGDENIVSDVTIINGFDGISGSGVMSPWIRNVTADGHVEDGIELDSLIGDLLIENSSFDGNGNDGINIDTITGNVTILNTTADGNGNDGLVIGNVTGDVFVDPSSFSGNLASGGEDTGVYIYTIVGNVTLLDLTIVGNTGTGLLIDDVIGNVLVQNSVISGNSNYGIEIYDVNGNTTLTNVTANGNDQSNLNIDQNGLEGNVLINSSSFNNSVNGHGLEIYNVFGDTTITNVNASDNDDDNLYIGQSGFQGNVHIGQSTFNRAANSLGVEIYGVFGNTTLVDFTANDNDGTNLLIDQSGNQGNLTIRNSEFNRSVTNRGIEIFNIFGDTTITDTNASDNEQTNLFIGQDSNQGNVTIRNSEFNRSVNNRGIEIFNVFGDTTITGTNANDNNQTNLFIDQGSNAGNVLIDPSFFNRSVNGRGIDLRNVDGSVTLEEVEANDNDGRNIHIVNVTGNVSLDNTEGNRSNTARGLFIDGAGDVNITNSTFDNNEERNISIDNAGNVTLSNVSGSNSANGRGLDIDSSGDVDISDSTFDNNENRNIDITNVDSVIFDNVSGSNSSSGRGLDIDSVLGDVTITNSTFDNNSTRGIDISNVNDVILDNVSADNSGSSDGLRVESSNSVDIDNSTFNNNGDDGLEIDSIDTTLNNSTITGNSDVGILIAGAPTVAGDNNTLSGNGTDCSAAGVSGSIGLVGGGTCP